jgi:hypothetical protein
MGSCWIFLRRTRTAVTTKPYPSMRSVGQWRFFCPDQVFSRCESTMKTFSHKVWSVNVCRVSFATSPSTGTREQLMIAVPGAHIVKRTNLTISIRMSFKAGEFYENSILNANSTCLIKDRIGCPWLNPNLFPSEFPDDLPYTSTDEDTLSTIVANPVEL